VLALTLPMFSIGAGFTVALLSAAVVQAGSRLRLRWSANRAPG
jgi:hypothetical protein